MSNNTLHEKPAKGWSRRKESRPGEILEAALKVFADKGYAATRMDDVAALAGVTKGTIYLYFPSKDEVFKSMVRDMVGPKIADFTQQMRAFEGQSSELLAMLLSTISEFLQDPERAMLPKIIISESGNFPELARFWRTEVVDRLLSMISDVITRGIERGEFRKIPSEYAARLCASPIILSVIWNTTFGHDDPSTFDYQKFLNMHLDVLINGFGL